MWDTLAGDEGMDNILSIGIATVSAVVGSFLTALVALRKARIEKDLGSRRQDSEDFKNLNQQQMDWIQFQSEQLIAEQVKSNRMASTVQDLKDQLLSLQLTLALEKDEWDGWPFAVWVKKVVESDGKVEFIRQKQNPHYELLTGLTPGQCLGRRDSQILPNHPKITDLWYRHDKQVYETRRPVIGMEYANHVENPDRIFPVYVVKWAVFNNLEHSVDRIMGCALKYDDISAASIGFFGNLEAVVSYMSGTLPLIDTE